MEQSPHVWIQLSLNAPCIPSRGGKEENTSAQQILWLSFLGYRCLDLPAWSNALQRGGQHIYNILRVATRRGKDDMENSKLNEVRGIIGVVIHELPPLSTSDWLYRVPRVTISSGLGQRLTATVPPLLAAILNESAVGGMVVLPTPLLKRTTLMPRTPLLRFVRS
jgi:hypothetical protein